MQFIDDAYARYPGAERVAQAPTFPPQANASPQHPRISTSANPSEAADTFGVPEWEVSLMMAQRGGGPSTIQLSQAQRTMGQMVARTPGRGILVTPALPDLSALHMEQLPLELLIMLPFHYLM